MEIYSRFDRAITALETLRANIAVSDTTSAHGLRDKQRISDKASAMETAQGLLPKEEGSNFRQDLEDVRYTLMGLLENLYSLEKTVPGRYEGFRQGYDLAISYIDEEIHFIAALEREF